MAIIPVANLKGNPVPQVFITVKVGAAGLKSPFPGFNPNTQHVVGSGFVANNPRNLKDPYPMFAIGTQVLIGSGARVIPVLPLPGGGGGGGGPVGSPIDSG